MKQGFAVALRAFEVLFSIAMVNLLLVFGTVVSLGILFPVLLVSLMNLVRRAIQYQDVQGILYNFVIFVKGKIGISFRSMMPFLALITLITLNLALFNDVLYTYLPEVVVGIVMLLQLLVLYQAIGMVLYCALIISVDANHKVLEYYQSAFILVNYHPIRSFVGIVTVMMVMMISIWYIDFAYLIAVPLAMLAFYIVVSSQFEQQVRRQKNHP